MKGDTGRCLTPLTRQPGSVLRFLAKVWPWPLVVFFVWSFGGQFLVGHYFNEFLQKGGFFSPVLIVELLVLSFLGGYASDVEARAESVQAHSLTG